jgi:D-alanyl-lipoteichoic acid acyltransferase DltB (MBOAT superfamily)
MDTRSDRNTTWLAITSLTLGILSFGLVLASFLPILWGRQGGQFAMVFAMGVLAMSALLGGLIVGIPGFIMGVIVLVRFRKQRSQNRIMRMAAVGIILNSLGIATPLIFFVIPVLLDPSGPLRGP